MITSISVFFNLKSFTVIDDSINRLQTAKIQTRRLIKIYKIDSQFFNFTSLSLHINFFPIDSLFKEKHKKKQTTNTV